MAVTKRVMIEKCAECERMTVNNEELRLLFGHVLTVTASIQHLS